jgi:cytochrome c oxidase subunit 4
MNDTHSQLNRLLTIVWLMLVVLTIATFCIGEEGLSGKHVMITLLVIALIKSQIVANYFMDLRNSKLIWRGIMLGYFVIVGGLIGLAYLIGLK